MYRITKKQSSRILRSKNFGREEKNEGGRIEVVRETVASESRGERIKTKVN